MSAPSTQRASAQGRARGSNDPSGRLLLRMPRELHGALAELAEREGTSLNQFITGTLASAIGWGDEEKRRAPTDAEAPVEQSARSDGSARTLSWLLIVNAAAVGLAAVAAIGLLLLAWLG